MNKHEPLCSHTAKFRKRLSGWLTSQKKVEATARPEITMTGFVRFLPPQTPLHQRDLKHTDTLFIRYTNYAFTDNKP